MLQGQGKKEYLSHKYWSYSLVGDPLEIKLTVPSHKCPNIVYISCELPVWKPGGTFCDFTVPTFSSSSASTAW